MAYVRVATITFPEGQATEGEALMRSLLESLEGQSGFMTGLLLRSTTDPNRIERITFWQSRHDADHASQTDHVLSLRSRINVIAGEGAHSEDSFDVISDPGFLAALREG